MSINPFKDTIEIDINTKGNNPTWVSFLKIMKTLAIGRNSRNEKCKNPNKNVDPPYNIFFIFLSIIHKYHKNMISLRKLGPYVKQRLIFDYKICNNP